MSKFWFWILAVVGLFVGIAWIQFIIHPIQNNDTKTIVNIAISLVFGWFYGRITARYYYDKFLDY